MRVTALILGLIGATLLLIGGCTGTVFGLTAGAFEETVGFNDSAEGVISSSDDVENAGLLAMLVAVLSYIGAGIAMVASRSSIAILSTSFLLSIWLVVIDTTSLFAAFYYGAIVIFGVCVVLLILDRKRSRATAGPYVPT